MIELTDEQTQNYFHILELMKEQDTTGNYQQWVADSYHCSETCGQKMTEAEMLLFLAETRRQTEPNYYVPDIILYRECREYWNHLCDMYPIDSAPVLTIRTRS